MPSIPFFQSHGVIVDFLVEFIEQGDGLDDHDIDFFSGELEFVPGKAVSDTQSHHFVVFFVFD
jgi:hypothetical protein